MCGFASVKKSVCFINALKCVDILRTQICAMWYVRMVKLHQTPFYWSVKRIISASSSTKIKCAIAFGPL